MYLDQLLLRLNDANEYVQLRVVPICLRIITMSMFININKNHKNDYLHIQKAIYIEPPNQPICEKNKHLSIVFHF